MEASLKVSKTKCQILMGSELTVFSVQKLADEIAEASGDVDTLEVDLQQVEEIDTAGIQLLLVLKRRFQNFSFKACSESAADGLALFNLADVIAPQEEA